MKEFLEKWKSDKKYRTKIKLIAYTSFVIIVSIYAGSLNRSNNTTKYIEDKEVINQNTKEENTNNENIINIPDEYNYKITISIDDKNYQYYGIENKKSRSITKEVNEITKNYVYMNNEYYLEDDLQIDNYINTTEGEVYDIINYNYINPKTINKYLSKAKKENNVYLVYLKDVILGNESDNYFTISIENNNIDIDYTNLMNEFGNNFNNYNVNIKIDEIE